MPATEADLSALLNGDRLDRAAVFLYGSDEGLISSAMADLTARLRKARPDLQSPERVTGADLTAQPALLLDFFQERPLFGDHRMLCASDLSERQAPLLLSFFDGPPPEPGPLVILSSHALKSKSKVIAAAKSCGFVAAAAVYDAPLRRDAISDALKSHGVAAPAAPVVDLIQRRLATIDPSSRRLYFEMLGLYASDGRLSEQDVEACLPDSDDAAAGELIEALLSGDAAGLIAWRRRAASEGGDPNQQLAMIARSLSDARRARAGGGGPPVFWRVDKIVKAAARRISSFDDRLEQALVAAHQVELSARRAEALSEERAERLMIRLAQIFA